MTISYDDAYQYQKYADYRKNLKEWGKGPKNRKRSSMGSETLPTKFPRYDLQDSSSMRTWSRVIRGPCIGIFKFWMFLHFHIF